MDPVPDSISSGRRSDLDVIDTEFAAEPWPWIASVVLDREVVLYDETNGRVHVLNESGSIVWQLLDGDSTIADIGRAIAEATEGDIEAITSDVLFLVRMLADLGALSGFEPRSAAWPSPP
jgi:hypothetical protein